MAAMSTVCKCRNMNFYTTSITLWLQAETANGSNVESVQT